MSSGARKWQGKSAGPAAASAVLVAAAALTGLAGCDRGADTRTVRVVATTTVLGDVVGDIVSCAGGQSTTLMPVGADPHDFTPSSADLTEMVKADLVVANGLGLEQGLADALANAEGDGARVFEVAPLLDPIPFGDGHEEPGADGEQAGEGYEHAEGSQDPHVWHDPGRMARAATLIADELGTVTGDSDTYERCGDQVSGELTALDQQVRDVLSVVPADRRLLVSDHEAFGYFAQAYDFEVVGVVIPGGSTLAAPSSGQIAALVDLIRARQVSVIFSNVADPRPLIDAVAREAGSTIAVVPLFVGSLGGPGSEAQTYPEMMMTNATRIAQALGG